MRPVRTLPKTVVKRKIKDDGSDSKVVNEVIKKPKSKAKAEPIPKKTEKKPKVSKKNMKNENKRSEILPIPEANASNKTPSDTTVGNKFIIVEKLSNETASEQTVVKEAASEGTPLEANSLSMEQLFQINRAGNAYLLIFRDLKKR